MTDTKVQREIHDSKKIYFERFQEILKRNNGLVRDCFIVYRFLELRDELLKNQKGKINRDFYDKLFNQLEREY